jgi:hypothetical protein
LPRFLTHLDRVLQDTPHRHCAKNVSLSFAKVLPARCRLARTRSSCQSS